MVESRRKKEERVGKGRDAAYQDLKWGARLLEGQEKQTRARLSSFGAIIDARCRRPNIVGYCAPPDLKMLPNAEVQNVLSTLVLASLPRQYLGTSDALFLSSFRPLANHVRSIRHGLEAATIMQQNFATYAFGIGQEWKRPLEGYGET